MGKFCEIMNFYKMGKCRPIFKKNLVSPFCMKITQIKYNKMGKFYEMMIFYKMGKC